MRLFLIIRLAICALIAIPPVAQSPSPASKEYQIKAAFLFNFTQFVEWPAAAFANGEDSLRIGILGDDPFGSALEDIVRGESVRNHKLVVQRARQVEDLKDCHLVFISRSEKDRLPAILAKLESATVLTVSEVDGFARQDGVINFFREGTKVRFEINPAVARRKGLKISSQLLSLGKIVGTETAREAK